MKNLVLLLSGTIVFSSPMFGQSATEKLSNSSGNLNYWTPENGQWVEDPDAPGTFSKHVTGGPTTGKWVMYVKVNPGAWINWHWHTNSQTIFAVSGTMEYEVRPFPNVKLTAGSYLVTPGHALHNGTCTSKEACIFFIENPLPNDKHMTDANGNELKHR